MKNIIKKRLHNVISVVTDWRLLRFLPDKQFIMLDYFLAFKKVPNLRDPKDLNEKLQWIKINGGLERYSKYVDKLLLAEVS